MSGRINLLIIISCSICLMAPPDGAARQYDCMREFPLFDYRAEGNSLPWGEYVMIRSFRETTQIVICRNHYQYTVYTDRNNLKEGDITASSYSDLSQVVTPGRIPSQREFDSMLMDYAMNGLTSEETVMFRGINYYIERIGSGNTAIDRYSEEYIMRVDEGGVVSEITVDARWKKLVIRRIKGDSEASMCPSVYIDQTLDKTLRRIITDFAYHIRKRK